MPGGGRKTVTSSTKGTKQAKYKEALAKLEALKQQIERGVTPTSQTVGEYLEAWMEEKRIEAKSSTDRTWSSCLNVHIIPELGGWELKKLSRKAVLDYVRKKQKEGLAPGTIHFHHEIIASALNDAVKNKLLAENPCQNITLPRVDDEEMQFLDLEQARTLLTMLRDNRYQHELMLMLTVTTGMQPLEIQALHWSDIDFAQKRMHIRRTLSHIARTGYVETAPKLKKSRRDIPLTDEMVTRLRAHHAWQLADHLRRQIVNEHDLVFCGEGSGYFTREHHQYHKHECLLMLALTTGARMGELQCLHWSDIDFAQKRMHVRRTLSYTPKTGYEETDPKTKRSRRDIPLTDEMVACLHAHHAHQLADHLLRQIVNEKDLIFCGQTAGYFTSAGIREMFKKCLKFAGLPDIRFHDLRHTFATLMLTHPVSATLVELRDLMGHTSIQTTLKYLHVIAQRKVQAISELGKVLFA
jgi:integrase